MPRVQVLLRKTANVWRSRRYIEKDPALERRFQQVYVGQPSVVDTIAILRGLKERCAPALAFA